MAGHHTWVHAIATTTDGRRAITGSFDKTLKIWNVATAERLLALRDHCGATINCSTGQLILGTCDDRSIKVWQLAKSNRWFR